jgi:hypothetical protein
MIPYEELVVALQTWRARKGLPIGQMSGSIAPPPPMPAARAAAPIAPPARKPPTQPPPMRAKTGGAPPPPPPLETTYPDEAIEHSLDQELGAHLDEHLSEHGALAPDEEPLTSATHAIDETHYENEGDDFAMAFGQQAVEVDGESTSISNVPVEPADKPRGDW